MKINNIFKETEGTTTVVLCTMETGHKIGVFLKENSSEPDGWWVIYISAAPGHMQDYLFITPWFSKCIDSDL